MNIYLSAGHSNKPGKDRGASANGFVEGDMTVKVRDCIVASIKALGGTVIIDDPSLITAETVHIWRSKIKPEDIAIDIHFNVSANSKVEGTEALVPFKATKLELEIADKLTDIIGNVLETPERGKIAIYDGVKSEDSGQHTRLAWLSLPGSTVLIEFQFLSNKAAMERLLERLPVICNQIAAYLVALQKA